jgi:hypothetical protein
MQKTMQKFINKTIYHGVCRVTPDDKGGCSCVLPSGVVFTGEMDAVSLFGGGPVWVSYIAETGTIMRNFKFKIIRGAEPYKVPHNMALVAVKIVPEYDGGVSVAVYVEKEL